MSDSPPWPVLAPIQRRLLGVLVEKAKTTPDSYPLTVNALTTGANQKSNRDPVTSLTDDDIVEGLASLLPMGLVTRITGNRVERWRHNLYEVWSVDKIELAILAELLLRGSQTEGELRQHVDRMDPMPDLYTLREKLKPLQVRGLIHWIGEENRRGSNLIHGFLSETELESLRQRARSLDSSAPQASPSTASKQPPSPAPSGELALLREELAALREQVQSLSLEVQSLKQSLGA